MKRSVFVFSLLLLAIVNSSHAQSLKDLLNKETIEGVISTVTGSSGDLEVAGTWTYTGSAVVLESDNVLKKAGGSIATSTIESKLNTQLEKLGIKEGSTTFTFQSDDTFTVTMKNKTQEGTYTIDESASKINLTFTTGSVAIAANVSQSSNEMTLTFDADKFMTAISYISNITNNSTLSALNTVLQSYDGVQVGLTLKKQ